MPCRSCCCSSFRHREDRWCADCQAEHERYLDDGAETARLALMAREDARYTPCSDEEWTRRIDDISPAVLELAECPMPGDDAPAVDDAADRLMWCGQMAGDIATMLNRFVGERGPICRSDTLSAASDIACGLEPALRRMRSAG